MNSEKVSKKLIKRKINYMKGEKHRRASKGGQELTAQAELFFKKKYVMYLKYGQTIETSSMEPPREMISLIIDSCLYYVKGKHVYVI